MPWFKVEDSFYAHPKVLALARRTRAADIGLWMLAGTWSAFYLTDGRIPVKVIDDLGCSRASADRLVKAGLWDYTEDGYAFHDWLQYQPSRATILARRDADRQRKAAGRKTRWDEP